jgi:hypothetical protein
MVSQRVASIPTTEPRAMSGASGPSAASAIPGAFAIGTAPPPIPCSGGWLPSPGSRSLVEDDAGACDGQADDEVPGR